MKKATDNLVFELQVLLGDERFHQLKTKSLRKTPRLFTAHC